MERTDINPWTWPDAFGFSQAIEVRGAQRVLYCAGQTSVDAEANPLHAGDMAAQIQQALDNLEAVLAQAGLQLVHVVRLNYYTTDMAARDPRVHRSRAHRGACAGSGNRRHG